MSILLRNHLVEPATAGRWPRCECGEPTAADGQPCERCKALDGESVLEAEIIRALQQGPKTCPELALRCGTYDRAVYRAIDRLRLDGRVAVAGRRPRVNGLAPKVYGWRGLDSERQCA